MGKPKSGLKRNRFGSVKGDRARNYFGQRSSITNGNNATTPDTSILDRLVATPSEILAIQLDTPILYGLVAARGELQIACTSSSDKLEDEAVSKNWQAQHLNRLLVSAQYSRVYGSPPKG